MTQNADEQKAQVQAYFSRSAEGYAGAFSNRTGPDLQRLVELGNWEPQQVVLDIATGGGHTALAIAPHVAQITVTDLTEAMLEKARTLFQQQGISNATLEVADAEALPFPDASFDRVTCRLAPHHFPNAAGSVREAARVLKPGGLFLLVDLLAPSDPVLDAFYNKVEQWRDNSHGRSFTREEWENFFSAAGLQVEYREFFRNVYEYDSWTERSGMKIEEKAALETYILERTEENEDLARYFEVRERDDGHLDSFVVDFIFLKGRKSAS